jgi:hypothetical protein
LITVPTGVGRCRTGPRSKRNCNGFTKRAERSRSASASARARGRYGEGDEAEEGREDEGAAAIELDRLMTRIRAVEGKLARARRGVKPRFG